MRWIYAQPKLTRMVGQALFSVGGFVIVCGLVASAGMTALNQGRSIGKMPSFTGLAEAYPTYPLWWVPEHFIGYAVAALIAGLGIYLAITAKSALKPTRTNRGR